jgi:hypothetical protein
MSGNSFVAFFPLKIGCFTIALASRRGAPKCARGGRAPRSLLRSSPTPRAGKHLATSTLKRAFNLLDGLLHLRFKGRGNASFRFLQMRAYGQVG